MLPNNQWFIITSEEIREIRTHMSLIEDKGSPECQKSARAVLDLLAFVRGRLP